MEPRASIPHLDKAAHLCEYLLFAWILVQALRSQTALRREHLWLVWIYATSYGLLIELVQAMLPWRSADLTDAAMNALGAALGLCLPSVAQWRSGKVTPSVTQWLGNTLPPRH